MAITGIGSGLDISNIVSALVEADGAPKSAQLTRLERVPHQIADAAAVIFHARKSLLLAGEEQASRRRVDDAAAGVVRVLDQP